MKMKDKKHIDKLFQEKLKDLEVRPHDSVWEGISAELQEQHGGKKLIPIWWRIVGAAAGIALLVTIGNFVFNDSSSDVNVPETIVDTEQPTESASDKAIENVNIDQPDLKELTDEETLNNHLVPQNKVTGNMNDNSSQENAQENDKVNRPSNVEEVDKRTEAVAGSPTNEGPNTILNKQNDPLNNQLINDETEVANVVETEGAKIIDDKDNIAQRKTDNAVANNEDSQDLQKQQSSGTPVVDEKTGNDLVKPDARDAVAESSSLKDQKNKSVLKTDAENAIAETEKAVESTEIKDDKETTEVVEPSIEEAIAATEDAEEINEKEKEVINRWGVSASVSPVYYNTLGNGSSFDNQFNNNSKNGQLNLAYGVKASYDISDRLSIRSGVNSVNVGYNTNDIIIFQSLNPPSGGALAVASTMRNIDLKEPYQSITVISGEALAFTQVPGALSQNIKSSLDQEISYIEVPVELEYRLSDKKVGVSLIGGFSAMILNGNEVYAELNNARTLLGEANNINDLSYSANLGIGLGVKISEKTTLNFEPTFKYQINSFKDSNIDFKPYIIGLNSGLKIKF